MPFSVGMKKPAVPAAIEGCWDPIKIRNDRYISYRKVWSRITNHVPLEWCTIITFIPYLQGAYMLWVIVEASLP